MYSLKNIKYFDSRNGQGMNANLYKGRDLVAKVNDEGRGGQINYYFQSREEQTAFDAFVSDWFNTSGEREKKDLEMAPYRDPNDPNAGNWSTAEIRDAWVSFTEFQVEEAKLLKRMSKKGTPFRLKGDPEGDWRTVNAPYTPEVEAWLKKQFGDQIERIHIEGKPAAESSPAP